MELRHKIRHNTMALVKAPRQPLGAVPMELFPLINRDSNDLRQILYLNFNKIGMRII